MLRMLRKSGSASFVLKMIAKFRYRHDWRPCAQETGHRCYYQAIVTDPQDQKYGVEKSASLRAVSGARVNVLV